MERLLNMRNKNVSRVLLIEKFDPDYINDSGDCYWYKNNRHKNLLHRNGDIPAVINSDGTMQWFKNGKRHRDGDRPAVIYNTGNMEWWENGNLVTFSSD